jgi:hypothetical protein
MNDDYLFPESEDSSGSHKKSRFERDLERFGSASAVRAAKLEADEVTSSGGKKRKSGSAAVAAALGVERTEAKGEAGDALLDPPASDEVHFSETNFANPYVPSGEFDAAMEDFASMSGKGLNPAEESAATASNSVNFAGIAQEIEAEFRDAFGSSAYGSSADNANVKDGRADGAANADPIKAAMEEAIPEIARRGGRRRRPAPPPSDEKKKEMFAPLTPEVTAGQADASSAAGTAQTAAGTTAIVQDDLAKAAEAAVAAVAAESEQSTQANASGSVNNVVPSGRSLEPPIGGTNRPGSADNLETVSKFQPSPQSAENAEVFTRTAINDGSYDLENEIRTGTLPKLGDLTDDLTEKRDKRSGRNTKSDLDIAKIRKREAAAVNALAGSTAGTVAEPRISIDAAAKNEKRKIRIGQILTFISNTFSIVTAIVGLTLFPDLDPFLRIVLGGLAAVGALGFIPFRFMRRIMAILYLFELLVLVFAGLIGTAGHISTGELILFVTATGAAALGFALRIFSFAVKQYYSGSEL